MHGRIVVHSRDVEDITDRIALYNHHLLAGTSRMYWLKHNNWEASVDGHGPVMHSDVDSHPPVIAGQRIRYRGANATSKVAIFPIRAKCNQDLEFLEASLV
jgi:hypothetical protein